jgi:CheY-specific phosphatase CheX
VTETAIQRALAQSVSEVLEKMFFLEALDGTEEPADDQPQDLSIRLAFEGDPPGTFRLRLAGAAANSIAADFLGADLEDLTQSQSQDVVRELANMICGAVLSRVESRGSFSLSAPQIVADEHWGPGRHNQETSYTVETGNGTLTAAIRMEERACSVTEKSAS